MKTSAAAAALLGTRAALGQPLTGPTLAESTSDPFVNDLALEALNAAKSAGASYADVRVGRYRRQSIGTRERQITGVSDSESYGASASPATGVATRALRAVRSRLRARLPTTR
ncbi:MAG: hypothetical protein H0T48_03540 [Gemmatimonadaceae bacterium]|nr:hypothetical protein [Gemmatimonadaceae bacterium]